MKNEYLCIIITQVIPMGYIDDILEISSRIHTGLVDFDEPRSESPRPTQASSVFITNKQQGDWAEDVLFHAINDNSSKLVAVRYGRSEDLVAGDEDFEAFYDNYQKELDEIGKRPDILLIRNEDYDPMLGTDISGRDRTEIEEYVKKAVAGIEVRSSNYLIGKYNDEVNKIVADSIKEAVFIRDTILNDYTDLLEEKRPEMIPLLQQLDEVSARTISYRVPTWSSSQRLQDLRTLLSKLKEHLKTVQKRNALSITPKVEDLKVVRKWILTYGVPHFYVQVFFDKIYGISYKHILELISNPHLEDERFFVEKDAKNQKKKTIKIPAQDGLCLAETVEEPDHHSVRKELGRGQLLFYVKFDGGAAYLDKTSFDQLFGCEL